MQPLAGIKILDLSTLLPGPLATLILAEAGADIIKVERPGRGDEMRSYVPKFGADSVNFALLNRGKSSIAIDLKAPGAVAELTPLLREADILVEQFRPGTLERLGLGYEAVSQINPRLIYASLTGYGQQGPLAQVAAHDLNYCAQTGMLSLTAGSDGAPVLPGALVADIAGGTYPAIINILLALRHRDRTGQGAWLDIAMADNLFTLMYWAIGNGAAAGKWPRPGGELVTGGTPRYAIYRTADDRFIAAAPLEDKFWDNLCQLLGLAPADRDDALDPEGVRERIAQAFAQHGADHWRAAFAGQDLCCNIVASVEDAMADLHFRERGLFTHQLAAGDQSITALPMPLVEIFRAPAAARTYPGLGADNARLLGE